MKTLKKQVEYCLQKYEETRNSDIKLTNAVWIEFYPGYLSRNEKNEWMVKLTNLYELPHEDNVKRIRAHFQNDKKMYLPTKIKIVRKRKIKEEEWRSLMGYNPELRTI
jgi:hypothetical protein